MKNLFGRTQKHNMQAGSPDADRRRQQVPKPQADTLGLVPVLRILPDMLITKHGKFVKMFEFPPVTAEAGGEEAEQAQRRYANVLASLPPKTKFQLTVVPEPIDPTPDLEHFFDFQQRWSKAPGAHTDGARDPLANLDHSSLEEAARSFMALITNWYERVNPVTWRLVITLSYMPPFQDRGGFLGLGGGDGVRAGDLAKKAKSARAYFNQQGGMLLQAFENQGLRLTPLAGPEMANVVQRVLNPTTTGTSGTSAESALQNLLDRRDSAQHSPSGHLDSSHLSPGLPPEAIAEQLAPDNVREDPTQLFIDGVYLRGYSVYDYNPGSMVHLHQLTALPGGFFGSLFVHIEDPGEIAGKLRSKETSLKGKSHLWRSKGFISSFDTEQEAGAVEQTRAKMEMGLENPISIRFFILVAAPSQKELEKRAQKLENVLTTLGAKFFPTTHNQLHAWQTALPLAHVAVQQKKRNMTPGALQTFFWPPKRRLFEEGGRYMGIDLTSGTPLYFNPLGRHDDRAPTLLAIGKMGSGKSVWLRTNMLIGLLRGHSVFAVDLEGEMKSFVEAYGGRYVDVGVSYGDRINVLDVPIGEEQPLVAGVEQLVTFASTVLNQKIEHGREWNALAEAYEIAIKDRIGSLRAEDWSPKKAPVLSDIAKNLETMGDVGQSLAAALKPYVSGVYAQFFNAPSTLDASDEQLVVFGMADVHVSSAPEIRVRAYLWQVMSIIWAETVRRHRENPDHITDVFLDEVWALLQAPGGGEAIENMSRRYRKRHGILWMATQEVDEFLHDQVGQRILKIVGSTILMDQTDYAADGLQDLLHFSDYIRSLLVKMPTGKAIIKLPVGTKVVRNYVPDDTRGVL